MDYDDDYDRCREELTDEEVVQPKKKSSSSKSKSQSQGQSSKAKSSKPKSKSSRKVKEPEETEAEPEPEEEDERPRRRREEEEEEDEEEDMAKLDEKIGFMGGGMMAYAIASGMVNRGIVKPNQILASGPHPENLERWKEMGAAYTTENEDVSYFKLYLLPRGSI